MKLARDNFEEVESMIRYLEKAIVDKTVNKDLITELQERLDRIDERYQYDARYKPDYFMLYELQAILSYQSGSKKDAKEFAQKAIDSAKHQKLISSLTPIIAKTSPSKMTAEVEDWKGPKEILFFHKSPTTVAVLFFFTLGIYSIYWFYKHWRAIRVSTDERTYPILSAIFQLFTTYPLFRKIRDASEVDGYKGWDKAGFSAVVYIVTFIFINALTRYEAKSSAEDLLFWVFIIAGQLIISFIVYNVQKAANFHTEQKLGAKHEFKKYYPGEVIFSIIGIVIFGILIIFSMINMANQSYPQGSAIQIESQRKVVDDLTIQYDACSSSLEARRDSVDTTSDQAVDAFNADWSACEDIRLRQNAAVTEYNRLNGTP